MPFAKVDGIELYYEITDFTRPWEGQAQTLVLLHGLHGHMGWWRYYQVAPLSQAYRIVTVDLRGHGKSYKPATGYSIEGMAGDLRQLLKEVCDGPVHIGGASMGGMVALQFALAYPGMVRSLILVDSYARVPESLRRALEKWIADVGRQGYARVMETFNQDYATALFSRRFWEQHPEFPAFETQLVLANLMPDPAFVGCCRAIRQFDVLDRLHEIKMPVLVVTPPEAISYEEGVRMARCLPHAELWAPEGAGHSVNVEIPEEFNRRVLHFLKQVTIGG